jgi:hypothetical protein
MHINHESSNLTFQATCRRVTAVTQKQQLATRQQEENREDMIHRLKEEKLFDANLAAEKRVANKRYIRQMEIERQEREMDEAITNVSRVVAIRLLLPCLISVLRDAGTLPDYLACLLPILKHRFYSKLSSPT